YHPYRCRTGRCRPVFAGGQRTGRQAGLPVGPDRAGARHGRAGVGKLRRPGPPVLCQHAGRHRSGRRHAERHRQAHPVPDGSQQVRQRQRDHGGNHPPTLSGTLDHRGRQPAQGRSVRGRGHPGALTSAARRPRAVNPAGKPVRAASGVRITAGVPQARLFERLGLQTPADFVTHLPLRYEDETRITPIGDARPGEHALFEGEIVDSEIRFGPRRTLQATLADDSGRLGLRWLHVYPGQQARLHAGRRVRARGEVRAGFHGLEIVHPLITEPGTPLPDALTPVYPTTQGLPQAALRKAIARALDEADLRDTLPAEVRQAYGLADFEPSLRLLHRPGPDISLELLAEHRHPAWRRIKFDELLAQQLALADARAARRAQAARSLRGNGSLTGRLLAALPFEPTGAQLRAVAQIGEDLARTHPMHRLLQGDVGSGKTLVAALAAAQAIEAGAQVAVMAPTEILADQLWRKLSEWLQPLGVTAVWLTGGLPAAERRRALQAMASGEARLAVGTQALIQDKVEFESLGLVISDEQHRFGVGQRLALNRKGDQAKYRP